MMNDEYGKKELKQSKDSVHIVVTGSQVLTAAGGAKVLIAFVGVTHLGASVLRLAAYFRADCRADCSSFTNGKHKGRKVQNNVARSADKA